MYCENCGAQISDDSIFCPECGARQDTATSLDQAKIPCPFCGRMLEPDSVYCEYCGKSLTGRSVSVGNFPRDADVDAPVPIPPKPKNSTSSSHQKQSATEPTVDTGNKKTKIFPLVLGVILGITLLAFAGVRYGNTIINIEKPNRDKPQDDDIEMSSEATVESSSGTTSMPDMSREQTEEDMLSNEKSSETESEKVTEAPTESVSVQEPKREPETHNASESASFHNRLNYETTEPATLADFVWVTPDIYHGMLPEGIESLKEFEEIKGGWKLYIIDEPSGIDYSTMERLCRCSFEEDKKGQVISINWDYVHNNATDEGYEENTPDSIYYGSWETGTFEGIGPGKVTVTDFWIEDGHEYAVGQLFWPDGIHGSMFLVRP